MKRRNFIKSCALGAAGTLGGAIASVPESAASSTSIATEQTPLRRGGSPSLFPVNVPGKQWSHFEAHDYSRPVCGVVYRTEDAVPHGMPLGGVATGCIDVDTDGTFGYCTLFNSGVPTRGPMQYGFLGVSSGERTWLLSSRSLPGVENARQIHYWGHYPVVDIEYELDGPLSVGLRAWSPFIPGDTELPTFPARCLKFMCAISPPNPARQRWPSAFPGPRRRKRRFPPPACGRDVTLVSLNEPWRRVSLRRHATCAERRTHQPHRTAPATGTGYTLGVLGEKQRALRWRAMG